MKTVRIYPREALNALIGKPTACLWETSIVGYDVTLWRLCPIAQTEQPEATKFVVTLAEANRQRAKWMKA